MPVFSIWSRIIVVDEISDKKPLGLIFSIAVQCIPTCGYLKPSMKDSYIRMKSTRFECPSAYLNRSIFELHELHELQHHNRLIIQFSKGIIIFRLFSFFFFFRFTVSRDHKLWHRVHANAENYKLTPNRPFFCIYLMSVLFLSIQKSIKMLLFVYVCIPNANVIQTR